MGLKEGSLRGSLEGNRWPGLMVGRAGKGKRGLGNMGTMTLDCDIMAKFSKWDWERLPHLSQH